MLLLNSGVAACAAAACTLVLMTFPCWSRTRVAEAAHVRS